MFGLSWDQIILILLAGLFLLGPERIPTAIKWLMDSLRKLRTFAAGAQSEMRSQLGPELDELRRQIAELQSLKELKELRELRDLDPRRVVGKTLLGDEFSGGVKGFLGLGAAPQAAPAVSPTSQSPASETSRGSTVQANGAAESESSEGAAAPSAATGAPSATGSAHDASDDAAAAPLSHPTTAAWADADFT